MPPQQQQQQQQQQGAPQQSMPGPGPQAAPATNESLSAAALAAAPPEKQKNMIGERLYPLIYEGQPALAGKITGKRNILCRLRWLSLRAVVRSSVSCRQRCLFFCVVCGDGHVSIPRANERLII